MASYNVCDRCGKPIAAESQAFGVNLEIGRIYGGHSPLRDRPHPETMRFGYDLHEECAAEVKLAFDRFVRGAVVQIDRVMDAAKDPLLEVRQALAPSATGESNTDALADTPG